MLLNKDKSEVPVHKLSRIEELERVIHWLLSNYWLYGFQMTRWWALCDGTTRTRPECRKWPFSNRLWQTAVSGKRFIWFPHNTHLASLPKRVYRASAAALGADSEVAPPTLSSVVLLFQLLTESFR